MLIAQSVSTRGLWYVGTSMMKAWLSRRSVRRPVSRWTTSCSSTSVCSAP